MDPIDVFEEMARPESRRRLRSAHLWLCELRGGGFRPRRIISPTFQPSARTGPAGSALGGTGIAVSARSEHRDAAREFAYWVSSGDVQAGLYAAAGGQPAHAAAWEATSVNEPVGSFYRSTRRTLEGAWLRPRHDGYMPFQDQAARLIGEALQEGAGAKETVDRINARYRASLASNR